MDYTPGTGPSLADIEPVVQGLWDNPRSRFEALELVFGRRIDASQRSDTDQALLQICIVEDAKTAFGLLLLARDSERRNQEHDGK